MSFAPAMASIAKVCRLVQLDQSLFYLQSVKDDSEVKARLTSYLENNILCKRDTRSIKKVCGGSAIPMQPGMAHY
jgi:hypothetical protein